MSLGMATTAAVLEHPSTTNGIVVRPSGLLRAVQMRLRRLFCFVIDHDMVQVLEPGHVFLRCDRCGLQTTGWTIVVNPAFRGRGTGLDRRRPAEDG